MDRELDRLRSENARLRRAVHFDALTGLYHRAGFEEQLAGLLEKPGAGLLVLLDINRFQHVNERSGHAAGDALLRETADTLRDLFFPRDLLARVDGDVFAVYVTGGCSREAVYAREAQLVSRLHKDDGSGGTRWNVTFSMGVAERHDGDGCGALFARAYRALDAAKSERHTRRTARTDDGGERGICTDMSLIRRELREKNPHRGAFCQDFETFRQIYRFVERGLKRSGYSAYTILMTLTDEAGRFLPLSMRAGFMEQLGADLQDNLRGGDLYTQYSGCQYLLMVLGASGENAAVIAARISRRFTARLAPDARIVLRYDLHPIGDLPAEQEPPAR